MGDLQVREQRERIDRENRENAEKIQQKRERREMKREREGERELEREREREREREEYTLQSLSSACLRILLISKRTALSLLLELGGLSSFPLSQSLSQSHPSAWSPCSGETSVRTRTVVFD
jgi:hypothetical protein